MKYMSGKGISEIIATILMLMITIGLAGTAFVYINQALTGRMDKSISVIDASCSYVNPARIFITVKNMDSKLDIPTAEVMIKVNSIPINVANIIWDTSPIPHQTTSMATIDCSGAGISCTAGQSHIVRVTGPSNYAESQTTC